MNDFHCAIFAVKVIHWVEYMERKWDAPQEMDRLYVAANQAITSAYFSSVSCAQSDIHLAEKLLSLLAEGCELIIRGRLAVLGKDVNVIGMIELVGPEKYFFPWKSGRPPMPNSYHIRSSFASSHFLTDREMSNGLGNMAFELKGDDTQQCNRPQFDKEREIS